jgi:Nucleotidyl transferase AbiEii toxin, Type IV TA system
MRLAVEADGIEFAPDSIAVQPIRAGSTVLGLRAKFDALLGRTKLRYQVDVGLGDAVFPETVELVPGGLLGMPMASVRAYTPYTTVAEKLEAMVVRGDANTRTKDYYDLLLLPRALAFDGPTIVESIRRTFARRATPIPAEPLEGMADAFAREPLHANRWLGFLEKNHLAVAEDDLIGVVTGIRRFAQPILDAARDDVPFRKQWPMGGPWREAGGTSDG